ncbi:hypothetical protein O5D80_002320 [Batrachochytrium dendrobatidis]|nr:hypothetical protein O5D80_002320 [Batrachochytrium dendrobatidis]
MMLTDCPVEVWTRIFSFVHDDTGLKLFPLICKQARCVSASPSSKALYFLTRYGKNMSFYFAYRKHLKALDLLVVQIMLQNGAQLPRFVAQKITSDYHMQSSGGISTPLFVFFVNHTYNIYADLALFNENDHAAFERLVRAPISDTAVTIEKVNTLIHQFKFIPVSDLCSKPIAESIYYLSRLNLSFIRKLIVNGFDLSVVNDSIMERVMIHPYLNVRYLKRYLDVGFVLSNICIKRALAGGRVHTIAILHKLVEETKLKKLACDTIEDLFGPYLDRNTSLNVPWSSETVHRIIHTFQIPDTVIAKALLSNPDSVCTFDRVHPEFPVTRCYLKARPYPVWEWVLATYGPQHEFSISCMDDALSRAVADQELHDLHQKYLSAGFVFRPRHIKILACRLLHRSMTGNSLQLLRHLREQVIARQMKAFAEDTHLDDTDSDGGERTYNRSNHSHSDDINCISNTEVLAFRKSVLEEIVDNEEWGTRMRTIQLEGGPRGGAVRIDRPPEDALRFLEEARQLLSELRISPLPTIPIQSTENSTAKNSMEINSITIGISGSKKSSDSWISRMQDWWRTRNLNPITSKKPKPLYIEPAQSSI